MHVVFLLGLVLLVTLSRTNIGDLNISQFTAEFNFDKVVALYKIIYSLTV